MRVGVKEVHDCSYLITDHNQPPNRIPVNSEALNNMDYPSEIRLKLKYHKISFVFNFFVDQGIFLRFSTWHDTMAAPLCKKLPKD